MRIFTTRTHKVAKCQDIIGSVRLDGPSREDSSNNKITCDKSGYYRINNKWVYCDMNAILNQDTR